MFWLPLPCSPSQRRWSWGSSKTPAWIVLASTPFLSIVRAEGGDLCAVGAMKGIISGLRADTTANPSSGHCDSLGSPDRVTQSSRLTQLLCWLGRQQRAPPDSPGQRRRAGQCGIATHLPGTGTVSNALCGAQNSKTNILNFALLSLNSIFSGLM